MSSTPSRTKVNVVHVGHSPQSELSNLLLLLPVKDFKVCPSKNCAIVHVHTVTEAVKVV